MVLKLACEEEHMKMMVRKEVFELLKIPLELVHLKNQACKVSEKEEEGELFFAATLTGENHTACGSVIQVRIHRSKAVRRADMLRGDSKGQPQRLFLLGAVKFSFSLKVFPADGRKLFCLCQTPAGSTFCLI